jgi:hypothetical protein
METETINYSNTFDFTDSVRAAAAGDEEAFQFLYAHSCDFFRSCIAEYISDGNETERLLQQTYAIIRGSLSSLENPNDFLSWGSRIAVGLAVSVNPQQPSKKNSSNKLVWILAAIGAGTAVFAVLLFFALHGFPTGRVNSAGLSGNPAVSSQASPNGNLSVPVFSQAASSAAGAVSSASAVSSSAASVISPASSAAAPESMSPASVSPDSAPSEPDVSYADAVPTEEGNVDIQSIRSYFNEVENSLDSYQQVSSEGRYRLYYASDGTTLVKATLWPGTGKCTSSYEEFFLQDGQLIFADSYSDPESLSNLDHYYYKGSRLIRWSEPDGSTHDYSPGILPSDFAASTGMPDMTADCQSILNGGILS